MPEQEKTKRRRLEPKNKKSMKAMFRRMTDRRKLEVMQDRNKAITTESSSILRKLRRKAKMTKQANQTHQVQRGILHLK